MTGAPAAFEIGEQTAANRLGATPKGGVVRVALPGVARPPPLYSDTAREPLASSTGASF
jgi:hypothetical protein